ncbi:MAG: thioredoxin TrxC [Glaciecola sp.]
MHIICAHCEAINRIPEDKEHTHAACGKCKQPVYSALPTNLNDGNFFRFIEKNDLPIVVDFWADWCGPCKAMAPVFSSVASESSNILFAKVDTQQAQQVAGQANIRSIPTLIFFHRGKEIDRVSGALREPQMKQWIMQCVAKL